MLLIKNEQNFDLKVREIENVFQFDDSYSNLWQGIRFCV